MATIGPSWADGAWEQASWTVAAWAGTIAPVPAPVPARPELPGGTGGITRLIMDKELLLESRIHADDEDVLSIIVFAIEMGIIE